MCRRGVLPSFTKFVLRTLYTHNILWYNFIKERRRKTFLPRRPRVRGFKNEMYVLRL